MEKGPRCCNGPGLGWGMLRGRRQPGAPLGACGSWGQNHNLRAASLGLALCPEPSGFRSQMSQQPQQEGGKGTQEGRCLAPLSPKPHWPAPCEADGCWAKTDLRAIKGPGWQASPLSQAQHLADGTDPLTPHSPQEG